MQVQFWLIDQNPGRRTSRRIGQAHDELGKSCADLIQSSTLAINKQLKILVLRSRIDDELVESKETANLLGQHLRRFVLSTYRASLQITPLSDESLAALKVVVVGLRADVHSIAKGSNIKRIRQALDGWRDGRDIRSSVTLGQQLT